MREHVIGETSTPIYTTAWPGLPDERARHERLAFQRGHRVIDRIIGQRIVAVEGLPAKWCDDHGGVETSTELIFVLEDGTRVLVGEASVGVCGPAAEDQRSR